MKTGARLGLAVTAGYLLGRFHKVKWALAVAAFASRGRIPSGPGGVLQQGAKLLTSSPELTKLTDELRGQLVEAGKAAAVAAVSGKINSLSDELRDRSDAMRAASAGGKGGADEEAEGEGERYRDEDRAGELRQRRHRDEDVEGRDQAERVPAPRRESERTRASQESRSQERPVRRGHPSRHDVESNGPHREPTGGRTRGDGRSRPRSTASRTEGDSE